MHSDAFAERILHYIQASGYKPRQLTELARAMGIAEDEHGDFHAACKALMKTGRIVLGSRNALMLPAPPGKIIGTYRSNPRGFGFVIPDTPNSHGDLFVPPGASAGAITGDTVAARVKKRGQRGGRMLYEGRVVEIIKRGQSRFVGELRRRVGKHYVFPDGNTLHVPIRVPDVGAKNARPGDQVVVEITEYPGERTEARGVIVKVLGRRGEPDVDIASIIEQYQFPADFPPAVLKEARRQVEAHDPRRSASGREDLRKLAVITIDPVDAKDFDDAISVTRNNDGTTELGVHIADVAHFIEEGSPLDTEARERANSVYLGRVVIPMLPAVLSNGLCSLQEHQTRLTKSVFITYSKRGLVKKTRVANSVVRSMKRLTYEQASAILDGKRGRMSAKVVVLLEEMETLARRIRARRLREGMLTLDLPAVEPVYDADGRLIDMKPADDSYSHTIIEMFMVEANEAVARLLASKNVPALRRIHDEPGETAATSLQRFVGALGYSVPAEAKRSQLQELLDEVRGRPVSFAVNLAVLRSMQRAEYSPMATGHYALASKDYCHFTSPIRRYPDLTIHRLIDRYIQTGFRRRKDRDGVPSEEALVKLGESCSTTERRAESAERELKEVLTLRLLEDHVGDEYEGVVTGVANVGVFVQIRRYLIEGLLRFDRLPDDWWEVDPDTGSVVGERTGHRITVGDRLNIVIGRVDVSARQIDFALAKPLEQTGRPKSVGGAKPRKSRKTGKRTVHHRRR